VVVQVFTLSLWAVILCRRFDHRASASFLVRRESDARLFERGKR
jgi:hypothetical protein